MQVARAHNGAMARLEIRITSPLPAPQAWARVLDLRAHSAVIPLTTVTGARLAAADLSPGATFVARTALGPVGFDDAMVLDDVVQPTTSVAGRAGIRKTGRVVRGRVDLTVAPTSTGSEVVWRQTIRVAGIPAFADPVVARVARVAYGRTLRTLLARD